MKQQLVAVLLSGLLAGFAPASAQDLSCFKPQSIVELDLGHGTGAIDASGDRLVSLHHTSGGLAEITVHDLSDPLRPRPVSTFPIEQEFGYDGVVYSYSLLPRIQASSSAVTYTVQRFDVFSYEVGYTHHAIDLTDPANPTSLGLVYGGRQSSSLLVGRTLYSFGDWGAKYTDFESSEGPETTTLSGLNSVTGLLPIGNLLYLCDSDLDTGYPDFYFQAGGGLTVLDVSNPALPVAVFHNDSIKNLSLLTRYGSDLLAAGPDGLTAISLAEPASPEIVATLPGVSPRSIHVRGGTAVIDDASRGTLVVDLTNIFAPAVVLEADTDGSLDAFAPSHAYVSRGSRLGVYHLDRLPAAALPSVARLDTPGYTREIRLRGSVALLADVTQGLRLADVSDPAHPSDLASLAIGGTVYGVFEQGDLAYAMAGEGGLVVVDLADPGQPSVLGTLPVIGLGNSGSNGLIVDAVLDGTVAYVGQDLWGPTLVVDIADPANPAVVATMPSFGKDVALVGGTLYLVSANGLAIYDVSDPLHPTPLRVNYYNGDFANAIAVEGGLAYIATQAGLWIVNVADPTLPFPVSEFGMSSAARELALHGSMAFVANDTAGLRVISIADPEHPAGLDLLPMPGRTTNVTVTDTHAYVSTEEGGMAIVDLSRHCERCPADPNGDGAADIADIQLFLSDFLSGHPLADYNGDGVLDLGDIQAFVAAFLSGC